MTIWIDAQSSPMLGESLSALFGVEAKYISEIGLLGATDRQIFEAAKRADAAVVTKDRDFVDLVKCYGPPPHILWITAGNTSNRQMVRILETTFREAPDLFAAREAVVEVKG
jgi:predicted nuclease of predicted toxin-antitoxin system